MSITFPEYTPVTIKGKLNRIVESQEMVATQGLVDTLDEQEVLENMLETSKPSLLDEASDYSYLLFTPFRYPPLEYGSRFNTVNEPSLFYGSLEVATCMAECAFYRLKFFHSMSVPPPNNITTQHTLFTVNFGSDQGLNLTKPPFKSYTDRISHISDYAFSQKLGRHLRENNDIECFLYQSARDPDKGLNAALFTPKVFKTYKPNSTQQWFSEVTQGKVQFKNLRSQRAYVFNIEQFFDTKGHLPVLA
ncbi:RES family NAD+ phosphorylase [Facilibium subflavum]|uniref:RES family NAD+ phosphorylase n=1 Tax=Facilibium subflavum TaxID=2219058 RepID=UPI000E650213|nr:RES family NAD+ phosphorylase [Facilibium subflavum]